MALRPPLRRLAPSLVGSLVLGFLVALGVGTAGASGDIRVAVLDGPRQVELGGGPLEITDQAGRLLLGGAPTWARVVLRDGGLEVRGARAGTLRVSALEGRAVRVNTRDYPGVVEVSRNGDGLLVVNQLGLEDYVAGAVKAEAGDQAPLEMLKAQAIAARTYAAYHRQLNAAKPYHVVATTAHQQYIGRVEPDSPARLAARETEGQVLLWEGALFPAFYHTDSGGHTEDPRLAFSASNMPALRAVRVEFPSDSPHQEWALDMPLPDVAAQLKKGGVRVGPIIGLQVTERSPSLRVLRILVRGAQGVVELRGHEFRRLLGYDALKSTLFAVAVDGHIARFAGRGYGHGVGMDQSRARTMAGLGLSAADILGFYYAGAALSSLR